MPTANKSKSNQRRRPPSRRSNKALIWVAVIGVGALLVYGLSSSSGVAYGETALRGVVDFSGLSGEQKQTALKQANAARCTCGCGLGLAECVATDSTCPIRTDNITRIQRMVAAAIQ